MLYYNKFTISTMVILLNELYKLINEVHRNSFERQIKLIVFYKF